MKIQEIIKNKHNQLRKLFFIQAKKVVTHNVIRQRKQDSKLNFYELVYMKIELKLNETWRI